MHKKVTVEYNNLPAYDIVLEQSYNSLYRELEKLNVINRKICIVTDSNLSRLYLKKVKEIVKSCAKEVITFTFPAGENSKNLDTVYDLYEKLIEAGFDRKDLLIALGGGVVGDLTGYAAATYLRGISFIQMPTSLLAMVDSSIGGKTGVDFHAYKNMIGAFHQPKLVYVNLSALKTLDDAQYYSGFGEIIKHGLIRDKEYYAWLKDHRQDIKNRDMAVLEETVYRSCLIKRDVVEKDPKESGERALLNFGHTIGHAIEKLLNFKLLHGECVAVGMVAAGYLSYKRNLLSKDQFDDMVRVIKNFNLPVSVSGVRANEVLQATYHDKKRDGGKINFILLFTIGKAYIDNTVSEKELLDAINQIISE